MAILDFPASPTIGQTYTANGSTWTWDGASWNATSDGLVLVTTSSDASNFKVPFANTTTSTTGNYGLLQDTTATFTYNPSTNTLVANTFSGALSGNASTATTWQTARTLWGQSVNGSADITAPLYPAAGTAALPAFSTSGDTDTGMWFPAADTIAFTEGGVESMRIDSSGNLLVGTTTINGRISSVPKSGFAPGITAGTWSSSAAMSSSGSFGGGFSWIDGTGGYCAWAENSGADFNIAGGLTGNVVANGVFLSGFSATSWSSRSDERLKQNLKPITDALNKTCSLRAVTGAYKNFPDEQQAFLIAQDVQKVLPEAVCVAAKRSPEQYLGLAYTQVIPLLVAAIQELKAEIDALKGN